MNKSWDFKNLFIFELANNHQGDLQHGLKIIQEISDVSKGFDFTFAFKLQYRDLDSFIHPDFKENKQIKYVRRFMESRLSNDHLKSLKDEIKKRGFLAICTPFDENSVSLAEGHGFDIIKIGSCSFTDWPLLERMAKSAKPVIASTAGASLDDIDKVVLFFEHRENKFALMHCVGEYSTPNEHLELNQIDLLRQRYPDIAVGYSTHEDPDNISSIQMAIAKGALIFEKHVGMKTDSHNLNSYSAEPKQIIQWLSAAREAFKMCGVSGARRGFGEKEKSDLRGLQRGVFAKRDIARGEKIDASCAFFAIPNMENQIVANDMSKYAEFIAQSDIQANKAILFSDVLVVNLRKRILVIINKVKPILVKSGVSLPNKLEFELSHQYGIEQYEQWGAALINCINREYCKKLIIMLPGQSHPMHYHVKKEETFNVLYGDITVNLNGQDKACKPGDMVVIERELKHSFRSNDGGIFEEISTTYYGEDSFYEDQGINTNNKRKTYMTFWLDWLYRPLK